MGTAGEKKGERSRMLEAPVLGGEFYISFIENWQILEGIQLGKSLFKDHLEECRKKVFQFILRIKM